MTIKELRKTIGMTQKDFGEYLNIPHRTIQNWESEHRTPPEYVTELIEYKIKKENNNMKKYKVEITRNNQAWTEEIQAENEDNACYKALEPYAKKVGGKVVHGIQGIGVESPVIGSWPTQYKISYWATCLK